MPRVSRPRPGLKHRFPPFTDNPPRISIVPHDCRSAHAVWAAYVQLGQTKRNRIQMSRPCIQAHFPIVTPIKQGSAARIIAFYIGSTISGSNQVFPSVPGNADRLKRKSHPARVAKHVRRRRFRTLQRPARCKACPASTLVRPLPIQAWRRWP